MSETEMAQPDQAVSIRVNSEEDPSDKVDDPGRETTKTDMKVVISITPDSEKEGEDQTQSLTESESLESGDSLGSQETGLVNKAYVEDETEQSNVKVGKRRGHQRSPSYSPNKDDEVHDAKIRRSAPAINDIVFAEHYCGWWWWE